MTLTNIGWLVVTFLVGSFAWIQLVQRRVSGWDAALVWFMIFGVGVSWIRGYHKSKNDDAPR